MNRRDFFQRFALAGAAIFSGISITKAAGPIPPFKMVGNLCILNPEWESAAFEFCFVKADGTRVNDPYPFRFRDKTSALAWFNKQIELDKRS